MKIKHNPQEIKVVSEETFDILGLTKEQMAGLKALLGRCSSDNEPLNALYKEFSGFCLPQVFVADREGRKINLLRVKVEE